MPAHVQEGGGGGFSEYAAGLQQLSIQAPAAALIDAARSGLPGDALLEQFQRAEAYVSRHARDFSADAHQLLEVGVTLSQVRHVGWGGCASIEQVYQSTVTPRQCLVIGVHRTSVGVSVQNGCLAIGATPSTSCQSVQEGTALQLLESLDVLCIRPMREQWRWPWQEKSNFAELRFYSSAVRLACSITEGVDDSAAHGHSSAQQVASH